jgi:hypothetical protein
MNPPRLGAFWTADGDDETVTRPTASRVDDGGVKTCRYPERKTGCHPICWCSLAPGFGPLVKS